jgi:hypothetical protein
MRRMGHHHQIGIATELDRTLAMTKPKQPRRIGRQQTRGKSHVEVSQGQAFHQECVQHLPPRHAG